jgi:uncharacterized protein (DUF2164 family)
MNISYEEYAVLEKLGIYNYTTVIPDSIILICKKVVELEDRIAKLEKERG